MQHLCATHILFLHPTDVHLILITRLFGIFVSDWSVLTLGGLTSQAHLGIASHLDLINDLFANQLNINMPINNISKQLNQIACFVLFECALACFLAWKDYICYK